VSAAYTWISVSTYQNKNNKQKQKQKQNKYMNENQNPELKPNLPPAIIKDTEGNTVSLEYQVEGSGDSAVVFIEPTPGIRVYLDTFGGSLAGLSFHYPQLEHETPEKAIEVGLQKYGAERLLNLINNSLKNFTTAKVRNSKVKALEVLKEDGSVDENATELAINNVRQNNPLLFTAQEAFDYLPMQREETVQSLMKRANKAQKEGKLDEFFAIWARVQEMMTAKKNLQEAASR
jgi:hypothetical protein